MKKMANKIDLLQNKKIRSLFYLVATLGAATSLFVFFENRKYNKAKEHLASMNLEIKKLELEKLRSEKEKGVF